MFFQSYTREGRHIETVWLPGDKELFKEVFRKDPMRMRRDWEYGRRERLKSWLREFHRIEDEMELEAMCEEMDKHYGRDY